MITTKRPRIKGFTLIELLVVVAIIGLLSGIIIASINSARAKARDTRRASDLTQLRNAFNLYASDHGGSFPNHSGGVFCLGLPNNSPCWSGYLLNPNYDPSGHGARLPNLSILGNDSLNNDLKTYISSIPADPSPTRTEGDSYLYFQGWADVHCIGGQGAIGSWIVYYPDNVNIPNRDTQCKVGGAMTACCSGLGCGGTGLFCVLPIDINQSTNTIIPQ